MSKLILIPTPLQDDLPLESVALRALQEDCLKEDVVLLVEEHKIGRQRWLKWGLPREAIEKFVLFNEHTQEKIQGEIIAKLKEKKTVYLMSDCGLPAFCDPGQKLVDACHKQNITVTSTPFPNSIALAMALSGFPHGSFFFGGFIPLKDPERTDWLKVQLKRPEPVIMMDTPYRLKKLVEELVQIKATKEIFLGLDLGAPNERLLRGSASRINTHAEISEKREFILILGPL